MPDLEGARQASSRALSPSPPGLSTAPQRHRSMFHSTPARSTPVAIRAPLTSLLLLSALAPLSFSQATGDRVLAWNDLGMHCIDPDFSVFSILPPYNDINSQLILNGQLVDMPAGVQLTYEGVMDASGSINTTSIGKSNFWDHVYELFGVNLPPDMGLAGNMMPGLANVPQPMLFNPSWNWFSADGIPMTPLDNSLTEKPYPLMRINARTAQGALLASTITTVPISYELDCTRCHGSGSSPYARPTSGWKWSSNSLTDNRWNILRLHDEREAGNPAFAAALATAGYDPQGLEHTAAGGHAILCATCHASNALIGTGIPGLKTLTVAVHGLHAEVVNESLEQLSDITERASCYVCHPGDTTQCLRGAMGKAIDDHGKYAMQCQSCHGDQAAVSNPTRVGWLDQPQCGNCHTGSATQNNGQIRYTEAIDPGTGELRVPVSNLFATTPDVPAAGFSLYRFSSGHGGLQCSACHGSPHAIYPSAIENDNVQSTIAQGHAGTITDCTSCHASLEDNQIAGPHGMHPVNQKWVTDLHKDEAEHNGTAQCFACHGAGGRGSVLSLAQGPRTFSAFGTKTFWEGFEVSCYACHNGPSNENSNPNAPPVAPNLVLSTPNDVPLATTLNGSDANGDALTYRIVSQPTQGTVGLIGDVATYYPKAGYLGAASFTYAAWDGDTNSNLATVTVTSTAPLCGATSEAYGFGCPGAGGFVPTLSVDGCAEQGQTVQITIADAPGHGHGLLVVGANRIVREPWRSCVLRVDPLLQLIPYVLSGTGAGQGQVVIPYTIPAVVPGNHITFQAAVLDSSQGVRGSFTNAWEIVLP